MEEGSATEGEELEEEEVAAAAMAEEGGAGGGGGRGGGAVSSLRVNGLRQSGHSCSIRPTAILLIQSEQNACRHGVMRQSSITSKQMGHSES